MRIRLPEHVKLTTDISAATPETQVTPLLFISLIENAFKHGVSHNKPSFIDLKIHQEGTRIVCSIRNSDFPKDNGQDKSGSGIGLQNLSRRLELLYPSHHIFTYGQKRRRICLPVRIAGIRIYCIFVRYINTTNYDVNMCNHR